MVYVIWTRTALDDLRKIKEYIEKQAPQAAARFTKELVEAPRRLADFPLSGQVVPELAHLKDLGVREVVYRSYRILYLPRAGACYIVGCIHGSRDLLQHIDPDSWEHVTDS
jgi:addiction module RelE/StbE family toxin